MTVRRQLPRMNPATEKFLGGTEALKQVKF